MVITETQRTTLYNQLIGAIGQDAARTLMEQLPTSGWGQVATKDDLKVSEKMLLREISASEKMLLGELQETEGRLVVQIGDSELRQATRIEEMSTRIDHVNTRIDQMNTRIDQMNTRIDHVNTRIDLTNQELAEMKDEVRDGFAELKLTLAGHTKWMAAVLLGFAVSMGVPLTIALL